MCAKIIKVAEYQATQCFRWIGIEKYKLFNSIGCVIFFIEKRRIMASINKSELTKEVSAKTDLKQKDAEKVIDALIESIKDNLAKGEKVQIIGFGSFEVRNRAARKGRNPQTGKTLTIPATKVPAFKPGKALKDAVK